MKLVLLRERIPDGFKQLPGKSDRIAGQIPVTCGMRRLACPPRHSCYRSPDTGDAGAEETFHSQRAGAVLEALR
jgi:hypothetical protein